MRASSCLLALPLHCLLPPSCPPCLQLNQSQYIRSVVFELGRALGCGAHLLSLRREQLGPFSVQDAWPLSTLLPLLQRYKRKRTQANRQR